MCIRDRAKELGTGVHAHLCEHKDEVSFCLKNYQKRPAAFLDEMGMVGENFLTAHNVVLSEGDITCLLYTSCSPNSTKTGTWPRWI